MNIKRLVIAIIVGVVFVSATDYLIHEVWLKPEYDATQQLWRMKPEMQALLPWMFGAQFLFAAAFVLIWAGGMADHHGLKCAVVYGLLMGVFNQTFTIVMYVVMPLPGDLAVKWFAANTLQCLLLGIITFLAYKPGDFLVSIKR